MTIDVTLPIGFTFFVVALAVIVAAMAIRWLRRFIV